MERGNRRKLFQNHIIILVWNTVCLFFSFCNSTSSTYILCNNVLHFRQYCYYNPTPICEGIVGDTVKVIIFFNRNIIQLFTKIFREWSQTATFISIIFYLPVEAKPSGSLSVSGNSSCSEHSNNFMISYFSKIAYPKNILMLLLIFIFPEEVNLYIWVWIFHCLRLIWVVKLLCLLNHNRKNKIILNFVLYSLV